jgi:hypothetical protein
MLRVCSPADYRSQHANIRNLVAAGWLEHPTDRDYDSPALPTELCRQSVVHGPPGLPKGPGGCPIQMGVSPPGWASNNALFSTYARRESPKRLSGRLEWSERQDLNLRISSVRGRRERPDFPTLSYLAWCGREDSNLRSFWELPPQGSASTSSATTALASKFVCGRNGQIRTDDPLYPKQVRYQTALRSDYTRLRANLHSSQYWWAG